MVFRIFLLPQIANIRYCNNEYLQYTPSVPRWRIRQAFPAASENSVQTSLLTSDRTAHREAELFELSQK